MQTPALPAEISRTIDTVVVHCSATPSGKRIDTPLRTAAGVIDQWHQARGFQRGAAARNAFNWRLRSIGYHYVVDLYGYVWTGRHPNEIGAHVAGHNARSLGICLVGGAELSARYTREQWASLRDLVTALQARLQIQRVVGHRELSPDADGDGCVERHEWLKTCPGFDVSTWLMRGMKPLDEHVMEATS